MKRRAGLRLPIDVWVSDRQAPDLGQFSDSVKNLEAAYEHALAVGDFDARAYSLWGLVARGQASLDWCRRKLSSGNDDSMVDSAGVLAWIGVPADLVPEMQKTLERLPDGEARDAVYESLAPGGRGDSDELAEPASETEELFGGAMAPFTDVIYFVEAPLDAVVDAQERWYQETGGPRTRRTRVQGNLRELLEHLEPFAMPSAKDILVGTRSGWSAFFSQGSDLSWVDRLAKRLYTRVLRTKYGPDVRREGRQVSYGGVSFWLSDGRRPDLAPLYGLRSIQASRQSAGWQFEVHGEEQPFEEVSRYQARKISDRFNLPLLNRYCAALGIERWNPRYYGPSAIVEEVDTSQWASQPRTMPSSEWRRLHR